MRREDHVHSDWHDADDGIAVDAGAVYCGDHDGYSCFPRF